MLKDSVVPIAVAVIGLIGALVGAFLAQRRWSVERRSRYADERRQVYKEIWDRAEALNLQYRTGQLPAEAYKPHLTALNVAMLKAAPYLDEADRKLMRSYVEAVERFLSVLAASGSEEARRSVAVTDSVPPEALARARELQAAQQRAEALRNEVVIRIRTVLQIA